MNRNEICTDEGWHFGKLWWKGLNAETIGLVNDCCCLKEKREREGYQIEGERNARAYGIFVFYLIFNSNFFFLWLLLGLVEKQ